MRRSRQMVYEAKLRALGYVRVRALVQPCVVARLDELALVYGSRTAALEALVMASVTDPDDA